MNKIGHFIRENLPLLLIVLFDTKRQYQNPTI